MSTRLQSQLWQDMAPEANRLLADGCFKSSTLKWFCPAFWGQPLAALWGTTSTVIPLPPHSSGVLLPSNLPRLETFLQVQEDISFFKKISLHRHGGRLLWWDSVSHRKPQRMFVLCAMQTILLQSAQGVVLELLFTCIEEKEGFFCLLRDWCHFHFQLMNTWFLGSSDF